MLHFLYRSKLLNLFLILVFLIQPLSIAKQDSQQSASHDSYIFFDHTCDGIFQLLLQIKELDEHIDSPLNKFVEYIQKEPTYIETKEMIELFNYAQSVLQKKHALLNKKIFQKLFNKLETFKDQLNNDQLTAKIDPEAITRAHFKTWTIKKNINVLGKSKLQKHVRTKQGIHISGKLSVAKNATFKGNVTINGRLSATDAIIGSLSVTDLAVVSCMDNLCVNSLSVTDLAVLSCVDNLCVNNLSINSGILSVNDVVINGNLQISSLTSPGILHNDASGNISTSLIVDADITSGTITNDKLANISSADIPGDIVVRDNSGNFATHMVTLDGTTTNPTDAATKAYVDSVVTTGIIPKTPALVVSLTDIGSPPAGLQTIDGVTLSANDRVLLNGQSNPVENGLWLAQVGSWIRPADFASGSTAGSAYVLILSGTVNGGTSWLCNTPAAVIDTDPISFILFSVASSTNAANVGAGTGLIFRDKTGNTLNFKSLIQSNHIVITNNTSDITLATDGTNLNTASTLVARDASGNFSAGTITANLNGNATSATTTTNFSGSLSGDVTGTQSATVVSFVGGQIAANVAAATVLANAATNANTANAIVKRDASGNFSAGTITANLNGNATSATTTTNFSGSLSGDVTGTQSATVVSFVGGQTAANVAAATVLANAATSANTANAIVKRDASGNFSAGTITANLNGNATTATTATTATNFSGSLNGDVTGTQSATVVSFVGGQTAANVAAATVLTNAATSANTANAIVRRSASGGFSAGVISVSDDIVNGNLILTTEPSTSTAGNILKGSNRFIHDFGTNNTFVGINAGTFVTSGTGQNSALGASALTSISTGSNNIAIGYQAGQSLTTGSGNIYINANAGAINEADTIRIGSSQTTTFIAGISGIGVSGDAVSIDSNGQLGITLSSRKFKRNIQDMGLVSEKVLALRPVTFVYNNDESNTQEFGLVAEEVEEILPSIVAKDKDGTPYTVRYHLLPVLLLNELKKQHSIIQKQQIMIEEMTQAIATLKQAFENYMTR